MLPSSHIVPILSFLFIVLPLLSPYIHAQDFGRRERSTDILHYDIRLTLNEASSSVEGDVRISAASMRDTLRKMRLDAVAMRIDSVFCNERPVAFSNDSSAVTVMFDEAFGYGDSLFLRIVYGCTPRRGMYFIKPDASFPDDPRQIWTQGQGEDNRHWLPCYDFPNDKATSELRVTLDTSLQTLSNGRLVAHVDNGDGTASWHWLQDKPHSSYLIMFAAGRYAVFESTSRGVPVRSYHYATDNPADVERTYSTTARMMDFFAEHIGIPYPWDKYAQISVAHFLYGGMENTSATVMADTRMVVNARAALDYDPEPLIAHELAHQWWGDYVTYIDWNNEWLNEGFATYYQQRWTLERYGKDDFDVQRFNGIQSYLDWADKSGRMPVVHHRGTSSANTYSKGAAVLHMLNDMLGEAQYRRVMHAYITRHALGSVETNDLKRVIEEVTGINAHWFFSQWLYKAGYPELRVAQSWDEKQHLLRIEIRQVQAMDSICGRFRFPLNVLAVSGGDDFRFRAEINGSDTVIFFPMEDQPERIEIDPDNILCGRIGVNYSSGEHIALLRESRNIAIRLRAVAALSGLATEDPEVWEALETAALHDAHREVRKTAAAVFSRLKPDSVKDATALRSLLLEIRRDSHAGVRSLAYNGLRGFHDATLREVFLEGIRDSSYYVEAAAMNCLLDADERDGWSIIQSRLASYSYNDILALAALDWAPKFNSPEAFETVQRLAGPGHSIALRAKAFQTLLGMRPSIDQVRGMLLRQLSEPRTAIRGFTVSALKILGVTEARQIALEHLAQEHDPRIRAMIQESYGMGAR